MKQKELVETALLLNYLSHQYVLGLQIFEICGWFSTFYVMSRDIEFHLPLKQTKKFMFKRAIPFHRSKHEYSRANAS